MVLNYPLNNVQKSRFHKKWNRCLDKLRLSSPGDLEQRDTFIKKLERYYEFSGIKHFNNSFGSQSDDYASTLRFLKDDFCDTVSEKFQLQQNKISQLLGDSDSITDFQKDKAIFEEAFSLFKVLRAFYKRWKLNTGKYKYMGERFDFTSAVKDLAIKIAKKRASLMKESARIQKMLDFKKNVSVLDDLEFEVSKFFNWYQSTYASKELDILPLEHFSNIPCENDILEINGLFNKFVEFYAQNDFLESNHGVLTSHLSLKDFSKNFSIDSEDSNIRMKAAFSKQLLILHEVVKDTKTRVALKKEAEHEIKNGFAVYFVSIDETYEIFKQGFISSNTSIQYKHSKDHYDNLIFQMGVDVKDGDMCFIFPVSKIIKNNKFYQVNDKSASGKKLLRVFSKNHETPLHIDVSEGIFIMPKNKNLSYYCGQNLVKENTKDYFERFFSSRSLETSWVSEFGGLNWLKKHCVFYDKSSIQKLLNILQNNNFRSVVNKFTKPDNPCFSSLKGTLKASDQYIVHVMDKKDIKATLFEWCCESERDTKDSENDFDTSKIKNSLNSDNLVDSFNELLSSQKF